MTIHIRQANRDDLPLLQTWTMALQAYENEHGKAMLPVVADLSVHIRQWLEALLSLPHALLLIAESDSKPAGFALGLLQQQPNLFTPFSCHGVIQLVWVDDAFRQQGIAKQLVDKLTNVFKESGAGYIEIQHIAANVPAVTFWENQGYEACGVIKRKFID